ncbi:MAG: winged helix-turn-helix transcriptional regulator [Endomicrobiales bacterium]|nr:winged helix-turn-helix transcriptional regulator [Endomicrobiales bacterium]
MDFEKNSEILKALGHPMRLKIVTGLIKEGECNVNKMVKNLGLPQSTVSQHLGILKSRGIIKQKKEGVLTCYSISDKRIKDLVSIISRE